MGACRHPPVSTRGVKKVRVLGWEDGLVRCAPVLGLCGRGLQAAGSWVVRLGHTLKPGGLCHHPGHKARQPKNPHGYPVG